MQFLKYNTATSITVGPFLTSGGVPITNVEVSSATIVDLYKGITRSDITTRTTGSNAMAHLANGYYSLALMASNLNTTGPMTVTMNVDPAEPFAQRYTVGTVADSVWDEALTGATHNVATSAGRILRSVGSNEITAGTVASALNNSIELAAGESSVDNYFDPAIILIDSGTGAGQSRRIIEYNGTTKVATVQREWRTLPTSTSTYIIFADGGLLSLNDGAVAGSAARTVTLNSVAEDVNDTYVGAAIAIVAGTGKGQIRVIESYNGTTKVATLHEAWATAPAVGDAYVIVPNGRAIVAGFADGSITPTAYDSTVDLTTAQKASVNAEMLDVIDTDTYAEPGQGIPGSTISLADKINYIYKFLRNKITTTSSLTSIYDDAGSTVDHKAVISDDGSTFTRGEFGSGP